MFYESNNNLPEGTEPWVHYVHVGLAPILGDGELIHPPPKGPRSYHLPNEIICHIVKFLYPSNPKGLMAPEDPRTQALIQVSRTCKALYLVASKALRSHCVFLDSRWRLTKFNECARDHSPPAFIKAGDYPDDVKRGLKGTANIFLRPFPLDPHPYPDTAQNREDSVVNQNLSMYDELTGLVPISRDLPLEMTLSTRFRENAFLSLNAMMAVLNTCRDSLDRVIIDLPLRYIAPPREHTELYEQLRDALLLLAKISEFIVLQDERYFRAFPQWPMSTVPPNWRYIWPALRPLMYYNPMPDRHADIWMGMDHVNHCELVIFMNYGGIMHDGLQSKLIWLEHGNTAAEPHVGQDGRPMPAHHARMKHRNLTVVNADAHRDPNFHRCPLNWEFVGSTGRIRSLSARKIMIYADDDRHRPQVNYFRNFPWQTWDPKVIFPLTHQTGWELTNPLAQLSFIRWSIWFHEMRRIMMLANGWHP
jgi:hypothetical protein